MQSDGYLQQVESKATVEDAPEYKISRMSGHSPDSKSLASECGTQGAVGSDDGEGVSVIDKVLGTSLMYVILSCVRSDADRDHPHHSKR
jgi:hypothetical protein